MTERIDLSHESAEDVYLRHRRRMYRWVTFVCFLGLAAMAALLLWGRQRQVFSEHYEFRRAVKPGMSADEVLSRFGEPYRVFRSRKELEPILAGRGRYKHFDRADVPNEFDRVLHYRTTLEHGEFVFLDRNGTVIAVITGRGGAGGR